MIRWLGSESPSQCRTRHHYVNNVQEFMDSEYASSVAYGEPSRPPPTLRGLQNLALRRLF